ncbi:PhnD/SsuA/transferrin family substrate-binding protein [Alkalihalobacillus sp. FSL R5-0424]
MFRKRFGLAAVAMLTAGLVACSDGDEGGGTSASASTDNDDPINFVWYPNESGQDMTSSRDAIGAIIEEATGREVNHQLTTDYAIAIETLVNDNAEMAFMGAQGYIEANDRSDSIQPLVVQSGSSGTIDDAVYYSWLAVNVDDEDAWKDGEEYNLDELEDKTMSFVSNSSTSGFKVPASGIMAQFEDKDLSEEDLMEGGALFSQVLFGNSHQGSAVNLLNDSADVAAFCDSCVENYVELVEGEENRPGSVYKVKDDAAEPFNTVAGSEFVLISVTPVLNAPFVGNIDMLGEETFNKLQEFFATDEVADNEEIFVPEDSEESALFFKTENERFLPVEDDWFNPIRELSNK